MLPGQIKKISIFPSVKCISQKYQNRQNQSKVDFFEGPKIQKQSKPLFKSAKNRPKAKQSETKQDGNPGRYSIKFTLAVERARENQREKFLSNRIAGHNPAPQICSWYL